MEYFIENLDGADVLTFSGDLSISRAADLKSILSQTLAGKKSFQINLSDVASIDLSCLQLLFSAWQTSKKNNISMFVQGDVSSAVTSFAENAGYENYEWLLTPET